MVSSRASLPPFDHQCIGIQYDIPYLQLVGCEFPRGKAAGSRSPGRVHTRHRQGAKLAYPRHRALARRQHRAVRRQGSRDREQTEQHDFPLHPFLADCAARAGCEIGLEARADGEPRRDRISTPSVRLDMARRGSRGLQTIARRLVGVLCAWSCAYRPGRRVSHSGHREAVSGNPSCQSRIREKTGVTALRSVSRAAPSRCGR